ncbi:unnamed protein product [Symbiodinium sp. KB8]|nr:unnamed protein product [Symbiodinium sp. KB8]
MREHLREPWTEAKVLFDGRFSPSGIQDRRRQPTVQQEIESLQMSKTCMALYPMKNVKRILDKTWNREVTFRQTWHGPERFDAIEAKQCLRPIIAKSDCTDCTNELNAKQPPEAQTGASCQDAQEDVCIHHADQSSRLDSNEAGSAGPTVTSERQDCAEASDVAQTEDAKEEPRTSEPGESCILTSRQGSTLLTASWVMRESRQASQGNQLGRIEEPKGYKSALDVLHELSARQPEKSVRRHAHRSDAVIMEHHHIHRHRHRHHRQVKESEEEAMLAALKVPKSSQSEMTLRLPPLNSKHAVAKRKAKARAGFDEMCELEGVTQSEMLTRWIDARWEAMGYQDSDLAEDVLGKCKDSDCSSGEPRSTKEPSTDSIAEGEEGVSSPSTGRSAFSRDEPLERQSPPRSPSPLASAMDDDDDDEEDGVPDIETWMRRYASRGSAEEDE